MGENRTAVFDFGSYSAKSGLDGEVDPSFVVSAILDENGEPADVFHLNGNDKSQRPSSLDGLFRPIQRGCIVDQEKIAALYSFSLKMIESEEEPVDGALVNLPPLAPRSDREFLSELFFEELGSNRLCQEASGVLATYSCGITTAMTLCSGDGHSSSMMLLEGEMFPNTTFQVPFGGELVNEQLADLNQKWCRNSGKYLDFQKHRLSLYNLKHSACYVAEDLQKELDVSEYSSSLSVKHTLPDGNSIRVHDERFMASEALFLPQRSKLLQDKIFPGIAEMIQRTATNAPMDHRKDCFDHVVLSGGNTFLPGFEARLVREFTDFLPKGRYSTKINVVASPDRDQREWVGGALLASLSTFSRYAISKAMYNEFGPNCIYRMKNSFLNIEGASEHLYNCE